MKSPIKYSQKSELLPISIILLSLIFGIYFYSHFPDQVANHWNFEGIVDGYTNKTIGAFAIPLLLTAMYLLFRVLPSIDPRQNRYAEFQKTYLSFRTVIMGFLFIIYILMGIFNLDFPINIGTFIPGLVGILMIIIGNFMGKIKPNWFMGIRTPWTLSSDAVWNKTHRVGGYLFALFGILIIISPFLQKTYSMMTFIGGTLIAVGGTVIYSYIAYRKEQIK
ncbi:SdpI family protein [Patescibacteria group bacterium]